MNFREEEWEQKDDEEKAKLGEDWPTQDRIARDSKIANKGKLWPLKGKCLFEAKRKFAEEKEGKHDLSTAAKRKSAYLEEATNLACRLIGPDRNNQIRGDR